MLEYNEFHLYLCRHGQSEVNVMPDMVGQRGDTKLTLKGMNQARLLGERITKKEIAHVYSSDLLRASETCIIALSQGPKLSIHPTFHSELREYSAGDWNEAKRSEVHNMPTLLRMAAMTSGFVPPNGESMHMVERRASQWLEDSILYNKDIIKEATDRNAAGLKPMKLFVFSHGMTIKCLLHYIMGFDQSFIWKLTLENTSISKLHFGPQGWRLLTVNDYAHLR
jgi:broad specificity phosphatase PhoE